MKSSRPIVAARRKQLGAWYTPSALVAPLVRWAIDGRPRGTVLDPSVGDGVFLVHAAREGVPGKKLFGFDVNPDAVASTKAALECEGVDGSGVDVGDFLLQDPPRTLFSPHAPFDAVVGNPPYVRYQLFAASAGRAAEIARNAGVVLSGLASSWAAFVLHAASFLREDGRLALILPEEIVHVRYAEAVREFLRRRFEETVLVSFSSDLFPDSQERVVALLCAGRAREGGGSLRLAAAGSIAELRSMVDSRFESAEIFGPGQTPERWRFAESDAGLAVLTELRKSGLFLPLRDMAKVGIGWVSGANDFFVLTHSDARESKLPSESLRRALVSAKDMPGAVCTAADDRRLLKAGRPCRLWDGSGADRFQAVREYVAAGERGGVSARYKCRVRSPWYVVPGVKVPHALLTYMSDEAPRMALNRGGFTASNNLLAVDFIGVASGLRPAMVAAAYTSAAALSAELFGRRYGGGVLKTEPREAGEMAFPNAAVLSRIENAPRLLAEIDRRLRAGDPAGAAALADDAVLRKAAGLADEEVRALALAAQRRRVQRKSARRPARGAEGAVGDQDSQQARHRKPGLQAVP